MGNISSLREDSGGICGGMFGPAQIIGCFNSGSVTGDRAAGICGWNGWYQPEKEILNCSNIGSIEANVVGGICGFAWATWVKNCYNGGLTKTKSGARTSWGEIAAGEDTSRYDPPVSQVINCHYNDAISLIHLAIGKRR